MKKRTLIAIIITGLCIGLTYKFWFNKNFFEIDFMLLIIIATLTFLISHKLAYYIADFNTVKDKPRIEIIFLTIFFFFLFVPISHINFDTISKKENRTLEKWKPLITKNSINYNFGKDFNNWFNDRFNLRSLMIKAYNKIFSEPTGIYPTGFYDKKNGMLYRNLDLKSISIEEINSNFKSLYKLNEFCNKNNIKLYIIITPQKSFIHKPTKDYGYTFKEIKEFQNYIDNIDKENKLRIIYPAKEFEQEAKNNFMFYQTEHHWTDDAVFVTYKILMKDIMKDFNNIRPLQENDFSYSYNNLVRADWDRNFRYGTSCNALGVSGKKKYHKVNYKYYTHKYSDKLTINKRNISHHKDKTFYYPYGANLKVLQIGNSQNENMVEFIPYTFKNTKFIRINGIKGIKPQDEYKIMKHYSQDILDYKPDILIFCISYYMITELNKLFIME